LIMPVKLIPSTAYNDELKEIMEGIVEYALATGNDAKPILKFFRKEEKGMHKKIKIGPLNAGTDSTKPVKRAVSQSGSYAILYTFIPPSAQVNNQITQVNLDSIMSTASNTYSKIVSGFDSADADF